MWAMKVNHGFQTLLFVHLISKDVVSTHPNKGIYAYELYSHIYKVYHSKHKQDIEMLSNY